MNWLYLTDSLVARWNFNDSTLLAETATITEATIDTGIMCSKGFLLKGNSAGINLGDTLNSIFTGADFSFSIWVYPTDTVDENDYTSMILSKWHTSGQIENSFILYLNSLSYDNSDANKHRSMSFGWPELNKWHNYVVVKKESETRVYRDNKLVGKMFGGVISESGYPLMVGTHNNTHYNLNGNVDELKVYNRALSEEFIEQLFTEGYPQALGSLTDQTINKGETITLDAGVGYDSYIWSNGVTTQMNTLGSITETILNFSVYAINNDGCFSDVISITIQTSGLNNLEKNTNVTIWPVPAVETINLSFDNEVPKKIEILNSQGQVVVTRSMVNSEQSINLSDMAAGIYILKLDFVSSIYTKAIIKQ